MENFAKRRKSHFAFRIFQGKNKELRESDSCFYVSQGLIFRKIVRDSGRNVVKLNGNDTPTIQASGSITARKWAVCQHPEWESDPLSDIGDRN